MTTMELPSMRQSSNDRGVTSANKWKDDPDDADSMLSVTKNVSKVEYSPLATHLPDKVVKCDHQAQLPFMTTFQAGVLFLDISGFTALCEKFSMSSKNGTDKLTKTLNGYMGKLAEEIINFDGDIMKYAGDAILTLWPIESMLMIQPTMWHMYKCCMSIQEKFGKWETDVGVTLRVKIGVAFGELSVCYVGHNEFRHYVTNGKSVIEVNQSEKFCTSGDVVFSPSAWLHLRDLDIPHTMCSDNQHVLVHKIEDEDDPLEERTVGEYAPSRTLSYDKFKAGTTAEGKTSKVLALASQVDLERKEKKKKRRMSLSMDGDVMMPRDQKKTKTRLRLCVCEQVKESTNKALRLYIAMPVLQKLDHNQPVEYLSEMRQVSIVFINLIMQPQVERNKWHQCRMLQVAFDVIYNNVKSLHGCMNKIFMFDKGCTFLVIFGLPGFKQENDCMHALQCAFRIKKELDDTSHITQTSIGVTTGSTFCGVVGHDLRHEYTVIGRKVNMAARLMMYYPSRVTCDNETFYHSKLPKGDFVSQETKQMKGLAAVGTIREYQEGLGRTCSEVFETLKIQEFDYPLLGREHLMEEVMNILQQAIQSEKENDQYQLIVFEGEAGIGKSRMLNAVISRASKESPRVISCALTMHDAKTPYFTVKSLLMELLGINSGHSHHEREHIVHRLLRDPFIQDHLSLLNDLLGLKFSMTEKLQDMDLKERASLFHVLLSKIAEEMCAKHGFVVFAIDDGHFIDEVSWDFMVDLSRNMKALVIMTIKSISAKTQWCPAAQTFLSDKKLTYKIQLQGLPSNCLAPLACQLLEVVEIPTDVESLLVEKSQGVPSWCAQLLQQMYRRGEIAIVQRKMDRTKGGSSIAPPRQLIKHRNETHFDDAGYFQSDANIDPVCVLTSKFSKDVQIPLSIKGIILARIDVLDSTDQMVVKCASILGMSFPRRMLEHILANLSESGLEQSLQRLVGEGIFGCATAWQNETASSPGSVRSKAHCECPGATQGCQFLCFKSANMQETAYEMFVENNRQQLHAAAALYLEGQAHKCEACGGGNFLPGIGSDKRPQQPPRSVLMDEKPQRKRRQSTTLEHFVPWKSHALKNKVVSEDAPSTAGPSISEEEEDVSGAFMGQSDHVLDVRDCHCSTILMSTYPQLVRHWRAVTDVEKTFHFLLETAAAAIARDENLQARAYLQEASDMVDCVRQEKNPFSHDVEKDPDYTISLFDEARFESLCGQALFHMEQVDDSMPHFKKAMILLGNPQPQTKWAIRRRIHREKLMQLKHICFPCIYSGTTKGMKAVVQLEQARCLSHLYQEFVNINHKQDLSLMTALQQVNSAEKVNSNLHEIIVAYANMMECCRLFNWKRRSQFYESRAKKRCDAAREKMEDLITIIHLHMSCFRIHLLWGNINKAVDAGFEAQHLIQSLHDNDTNLNLLPILGQALLLNGRLPETVEVLQTLEYVAEESQNLIGKTWYLTCCLELILQTGYQLDNISNIVKFASSVLTDSLLKADTMPLYCLAAGLTLWYARKEDASAFMEWKSLADTKCPKDENESFMLWHGFLLILEAKLINLGVSIRKGTDRKIQRQTDEIRKDMQQMEGICKKMPVFRPRMLHLQAYYAVMDDQTWRARRLLKACCKTAADSGNSLEEQWARHNQNIWFLSHFNRETDDKWLLKANSEIPDCHVGPQKDYDRNMFCLPLPTWNNKM